jgi:hypothetical protein
VGDGLPLLPQPSGPQVLVGPVGGPVGGAEVVGAAEVVVALVGDGFFVVGW